MRGNHQWVAVAAGLALVGAVFAACNSEPSQPPIDAEQAALPDSGLGVEAGSEGGVVSVASCVGADGGCSSMALCGQRAIVTYVASSAPTAAGGTITPGVYVLTNYTVYTGTSGQSGAQDGWWQETFELVAAPVADAGTDASDDGASDGAVSDDAASASAAPDAAGVATSLTWLDVVLSDSSSGGAATYQSGSVTTLGTTLNEEPACPSASVFQTTYTATTSSITLYFAEPAGLGTGSEVYQLVQ
jgi:hypothetical protein